MLEQLLNLVKENAGEAIINNQAIPNEQNDAAINQATEGIIGGLKSQLASGNISEVAQLLGGQNNAATSGVTNAISSQVSHGLMEKFGLSGNSAGSIVSSLIPVVLSKLVSKTNDPNDKSFDLNSIFNHLSGGKTQGMDLSNILGSVTGGNASGGGIGNVLGSVMGGDKNSALGGLMDIFKK